MEYDNLLLKKIVSKYHSFRKLNNRLSNVNDGICEFCISIECLLSIWSAKYCDIQNNSSICLVEKAKNTAIEHARHYADLSYTDISSFHSSSFHLVPLSCGDLTHFMGFYIYPTLSQRFIIDHTQLHLI